jgi:GDP-4-dehydro-6-deoxy-D-mannose reductase
MTGRVLVTGAGGWIGGRLEETLRASGTSVVGAGHNHENSLELRLLDDVRALVADVRPDVVFHLGGTSRLAELLRDPASGNQNVVQPAVNVLEALASLGSGTRLVLVSPAEVYGRVGRVPTDEASPLVPVDLYASARAAVEYMSRGYAARGVDVRIARVFWCVGPGQGRGTLLGDAAWSAANGTTLRIGDPELRRDVVDVRDVVAGLVRTAEHAAPGTATNLCSGRAWRVGDLLDAVGVRWEVDTSLARPTDVPILLGSPARAEALGWQRRHPVEETLRALRPRDP